MAKIAKVKKRETSVHSRAFRRNATPPPDLGKATKSSPEEKDGWMYNAQSAGVHKKSKTKKGTTRQQHVRHLKALEKADRNTAVLEKKIDKSKQKARVIQARAKDWDELNEELPVLEQKVLKAQSKSMLHDSIEDSSIEDSALLDDSLAQIAAGEDISTGESMQKESVPADDVDNIS